MHRLNILTRRLAVVAAFVTFGLATGVMTAQAQCIPGNCLTAETAVIDLTPVTPAPVVAIAIFPLASAQAACETPPNCLSANGALLIASNATSEASPILVPADVSTESVCDTPPDCLAGMNPGDR
jgi:hypothetical protein